MLLTNSESILIVRNQKVVTLNIGNTQTQGTHRKISNWKYTRCLKKHSRKSIPAKQSILIHSILIPSANRTQTEWPNCWDSPWGITQIKKFAISLPKNTAICYNKQETNRNHKLFVSVSLSTHGWWEKQRRIVHQQDYSPLYLYLTEIFFRVFDFHKLTIDIAIDALIWRTSEIKMSYVFWMVESSVDHHITIR